MRVLHITNWYPNVISPGETPFIKRHIDALNAHCGNEIWHVEVRQGKEPRTIRKSLTADRTFIRVSCLERWFLIEWVTTLMVLWTWWTRDRRKKYDLINIHVAYPLAVHYRSLRAFIKIPFVITEHWTAYHFNFHSSSAGLKRIRRIFSHDIPLICVSNTLADDIEHFAGRKDLPIAIVDNVVDTRCFNYDPSVPYEEGRFFAIASWRAVKRSDVLIDAIKRLHNSGCRVRLRIAGGGARLPAMRETIEQAGLTEVIQLLGQLDAEEVAHEMRSAQALLHCSEYETYSVVCAESLCCGTPVIVSDLEAVKEYLRSDMGTTVSGMEGDNWAEAIRKYWNASLNADRASIATRMAARAGDKLVGRRYFQILKGVLKNQGTLPQAFDRNYREP